MTTRTRSALCAAALLAVLGAGCSGADEGEVRDIGTEEAGSGSGSGSGSASGTSSETGSGSGSGSGSASASGT